MSDRILYIFEDENIEVRSVQAESDSLYQQEDYNVITVYEPGPKGDKGDQGPAGFSGAGEPFYSIVTGQLYATTASIAILASISSSLMPQTGSSVFSIGSTSAPWNSLYVTESFFIIKNNSQRFGITGDYLGYDSTKNIERVSSDQQKFLITSGTITGSAVNEYGVFVIGDFTHTPPPIPGGIFKSGSDFYFGI